MVSKIDDFLERFWNLNTTRIKSEIGEKFQIPNVLVLGKQEGHQINQRS